MSKEVPPVILIVEDDPGIAELEGNRLTEAGFEVLVAGGADAAIAHLRSGRVDLILLDYRLPGAENGLDFYARVKAAGFDVPVILVTGFGSEATVIQALRVGVRDFVTKSVEYLDYLPAAVGRVLRQVQTEHRLAESEARLAAIIDSAKDALIVAGADRRITLFNPAAERMFRCRAADALGAPLTRFIPDESTPHSGTGENGHSAGPPSQRVRTGTRGFRADGSEFPLEASVARTDVGGRRFHTVVVRDVTERKRAEEDLQAAKEEWEQSFNALTDYICILDRSGAILRANRAMRDQFEPALGELIGQDYRLVYCGTPTPDPPPPCAATLSAGTQVTFEGPLPALDGWYHVVSLPLFGRGGQWGAVSVVRDVTGQKRFEERVREQAALLDLAHDAIKVTDTDGRIRFWNRGAERLYGWTAAEVLGRNVESLLYRGHGEERRECIRRVLEDAEWAGELRQVTRTGKEILAHCSMSLVRGPAGEPAGVLMICSDVTERARLEQQLRQAQKMEVVGRLAGGVAHDFNNLLTVINGFSDMAMEELPTDHPARGMIEEVRRSGDRAAGLTRQLLAFSRQQVLESKVLDLSQAVRDAGRMLRRLIGEDVELTIVPAESQVRVKADPSQVEQVLLNLAVNARDAMPTGGRLTVETGEVELDEAYAASHPDVRPGRYALLAVSDTGQGMDESTKSRIFEPFFTTKEAGKGTGLGLSTVWGIVKQSGGHVEVYSEPGGGTTFKVYLPATQEAGQACKRHSIYREAGHGNETLLLAEDESGVRTLARLALTSAGYAVLEAGRPEEAVEIARTHQGPIQLLVTDVVMPGMGGRQLAEQVATLRPGVKVLYLSGYTPDAVVRHGVLQADVAFLQKPFSIRALTRKVRDVLDAVA
jgi:two-component system cell cycle sensor histidine kinase/response regulator CckA